MADSSQVNATPAKAFFVKMLTRDIDLSDAIMDLIDNCVDGIIRTKWNTGLKDNDNNPYVGFYAEVEINQNHFRIKDNCGGIPRKVAEDYAFRMGRTNVRDRDIPTVGVYGIGMKRALFKMGRSSKVISKTSEDTYEVVITPNWIENDSEWELPLNTIMIDEEIENGTIIEVDNLYESISRLFSTSSSLISNLKSLISKHYSIIMGKGFNIIVNGEQIKPVSMKLLIDRQFDSESLAPYIYQATIDNVNVLLEVGFYRIIPNDDELDEEQNVRRSKEEAGWTIICNDRVVLYKDKTMLTGWGEANVPQYHSQFIGISGIVIFKSYDASKLPISTTKRNIDTSSELYLKVKNKMRDGLKLFTNYTNTWKKDLEKERERSETAELVNVFELPKEIPENKWKKLSNSSYHEVIFSPKLPKPKETNPRKFIRFTRYVSEIKSVSDYLFGTPDAPASEVGNECFERVLKEIEK